MDKKKNVKGKKVTSKKKVTKKNERKNDKKLLYLSIVVICLGIILLFILNFNRKWERNGNIISKGKESYEIGDYYEYDETNGDKSIYQDDVKWKVLGVDEKGHLLIISSSSVSKLSLGSTDNFIDAQNAYLNGINEMNKIASKYGNGEGAINARSVTVFDIVNSLDLKLDDLLVSNESYGYFWDKDGDLYFKNNNGEEGKSKINHNGVFTYFDNKSNKWMMSHSSDYQNNDEINSITVLNDSLVAFNSLVYSEELNEHVSIVDKDSKKYNMLFVDEKNVINSYWTADRFIRATSGYAAFGFNAVKSDDLNYNFTLYSNGEPRFSTEGIRVVVEIK